MAHPFVELVSLINTLPLDLTGAYLPVGRTQCLKLDRAENKIVAEAALFRKRQIASADRR
jgi:hypothetical protein